MVKKLSFCCILILSRPLLYLFQDGAALCYCHHPPWRSHAKAKDENGGPTPSVSLSIKMFLPLSVSIAFKY